MSPSLLALSTLGDLKASFRRYQQMSANIIRIPSEVPVPDIDVELTIYGSTADFVPTPVDETSIADDKASPSLKSGSETTIVVQDDLPPADKGIAAWSFVSDRFFHPTTSLLS